MLRRGRGTSAQRRGLLVDLVGEFLEPAFRLVADQEVSMSSGARRLLAKPRNGLYGGCFGMHVNARQRDSAFASVPVQSDVIAWGGRHFKQPLARPSQPAPWPRYALCRMSLPARS